MTRSDDTTAQSQTAHANTLWAGQVHDPDLVDLARPIYEATFAAAQRPAWEQIRSDITDGRAQLFLALVDGRAVGFVLSYVLPRTRAGFVSHLAVDPTWRGQGIAHVFNALAAPFVTQRDLAGMLLEIDDPDDPDPDVAAHGRRLEMLYRRWGAGVLCRAGYAMPDYAATGAVIPLRLMWLPGSVQLGDLDDACVADMVQELWEVAYRVPADDARLAGVLERTRLAGDGQRARTSTEPSLTHTGGAVNPLKRVVTE